MISGLHSIIYSTKLEADRAFLRDVLQLPCEPSVNCRGSGGCQIGPGCREPYLVSCRAGGHSVPIP